MASSRNLSTYLSLKEQQYYLARRGYESIATRDWGPPGLRTGAGRGSVIDAAESRKGKKRVLRARRVREARGRRDETKQRESLELEVKLKRAPLQVHSWAGVLGWA
ncbi:unnamed protein product [Miscanthus lutarioriparius]|uniref:Uncharacterized protein n=1 Tax=Miscanthus lutarioriparius TaxID=422564 RepID=A0A811RLV8_9POAL|nr:unnamed protein product [Miscanthus lutarioriparius]